MWILFAFVILFFLLFVTWCCCRKENFKVTSIFEHTGIQDDTCIYHTGSIKEKNKCLDIKFIPEISKNDQWYRSSIDKIIKHNNGELCLNGCILNWKDRKSKLYKLLYHISHFCNRFGLEWVLYYGALLGWYRNRKLLPWDSDIDILMPLSITSRIKKRGIVYEDDNLIFKLHDDNPNIIGHFVDKETGLYCDIFYWDTPDQHHVDISWMEQKRGKHLRIRNEDFFPLQKSFIGNKQVPIYVPNNPFANLTGRYKNIQKIPYYYKNNYFHKV